MKSSAQSVIIRALKGFQLSVGMFVLNSRSAQTFRLTFHPFTIPACVGFVPGRLQSRANKGQTVRCVVGRKSQAWRLFVERFYKAFDNSFNPSSPSFYAPSRDTILTGKIVRVRPATPSASFEWDDSLPTPMLGVPVIVPIKKLTLIRSTNDEDLWQ